ncbi:7TM chemoreceptor [Oesophagostomum dentatum]|uniref:7TM chemoreceptor n=1 Tax=Oesophagostomum dentatum TaxID=61180 RepID=A0A0B1S2X5_OESDE|nr:7TM chemoreceptor [Oesophagostomum dentatum]
MLHCYPHGLYTLLFSFYYRYHVLSRGPLKTWTIVRIICLFYVPSFLQLVLLSLSNDEEASVRKELQDALHYDISNKCVSGLLKPTDWKCLYTQIHMGIPVIPVYAVILLLRRNIIVKLKTGAMSEKTRHMHSQLLKAITIQACMPILFISAVTNFILSEFDIYHSPFLEFSSYLSLGFIPVLTPLTSLYFIAPYRKWLINKLQCKGSAKSAVLVHLSISINMKN